MMNHKEREFGTAVSTKDIKRQIRDVSSITKLRQEEIDRFNKKNKDANVKDKKICGWQKQTGLGSIADFNMYVEIEESLKEKIAIVEEGTKENKSHNYYWIFGDLSTLKIRLTLIQNILEEYRNLRDNKHLLYSRTSRKNRNYKQKQAAKINKESKENKESKDK